MTEIYYFITFCLEKGWSYKYPGLAGNGIWGNNLGNILWQLNHLLFTEISSFIVDGEPCDASLNITWYLKSADCYNEIYNFKV